MPAPRSVRGKPYFQINSAIAWTTLALTIHADGTSEHELVGASPSRATGSTTRMGALVQKSGSDRLRQVVPRGARGRTPPGANEDSPAVVTAVETAVERELSLEIMGGDGNAAPDSPFPRATSSSSRGKRVTVLRSSTSCSTECSRWSSTVRWSESSAQGAIVGERAQIEDGTANGDAAREDAAGKVVGIPGEELNRRGARAGRRGTSARG